MSFDARESTIGKLLSDSIYRIPRNQRRYVWDEHNWGDLYNDIMLVTDGTATSHFLGSIVLKKEVAESGIDVFTVIDGQQRIITLTILISSVIYSLKKRDMTNDAIGTRKHIIATNNRGIEIEIVDPEHHRTLTNIAKKVARIDSTMSQTRSASSFAKECQVSEEDSLIVRAFIYFCSELEKIDDIHLLSFRDALISTQYVDISSSSDEDLYTIFEILNARGLPLDDSDLLKNFIMRYIQPEKKRDDAKLQWLKIESLVGDSLNTFLRHYAIHCCKFNSRDKDVYKKIRDTTDPHEAQNLLDDLQRKSAYYRQFLYPSEASIGSPLFLYFKQHRVQVFRPLILSLMHRHELEEISDEEYSELLDFIYKFYVCYKVIGGLESNQLTDAITKYSYEIEANYYPGKTIDDWLSSFTDKLPTFESFQNSFSTLGWSHKHAIYKDMKHKEQCRVVLELLEQSQSGQNLVDDYTIEHIMPDSLEEQSASIGNLLLLEKHLNTRCKNLPLCDKIPIYLESRFSTTRSFAKHYSTHEFSIQGRRDYMAQMVFDLAHHQKNVK